MHWRTPKHPMIKHYGTDCGPWQPHRKWNLWPLVGLLLNTLLWAGMCWIVTALL